ncbi:MAG: hypothetical protein JW881_19160 [Spirochaetales bacterium]|nr:hypothetical protein [Spirochaetales bacterium]
MRNIINSIVLCACMAAASCVSTGDSLLHFVGKIPYKQKVYYTGFSDAQKGVTIGYAGAVYYIMDGQKWNKAENHSMCRFGLEMLPDGTCYSCGNGGQVMRSVDNGGTWQRVMSFGKSQPHHARFLSFIDKDRGMIASDKELAYTENGGQSWIALTAPGEKGIVCLSLCEKTDRSTIGFCIDGAGTMWKTCDFGKNWTRGKCPVTEGSIKASDFSPQSAMRFQPSGKGIFMGYVKQKDADKYKPVISTTNDFGETWKRGNLPADLSETNLNVFPTIYISFDGKYATLLKFPNPVSVYRIDAGA